MKRRIFHLPAFAALISLAALSTVSAAPKVATDIPPVQSLAARVMQGVGKPESILPPGATPHSYSMRPSEAAKLADADIVFWVGESLTPWFGYAILGLAADAVSVELMKAPGIALLDFHEDEHGHEDEHDHTHPGDKDPHIWLDPVNGKAILAEIAAHLAEIDPANADAYAANATTGAAEFDALAERVEAIVAPVRGKAFVTAHDGYVYFEHRFEIESEGAVELSDAASLGPARLDRIRHVIHDHNVSCVFIEPQLDPKLTQMVAEGTDARIGTLDAGPAGRSARSRSGALFGAHRRAGPKPRGLPRRGLSRKTARRGTSCARSTKLRKTRSNSAPTHATEPADNVDRKLMDGNREGVLLVVGDVEIVGEWHARHTDIGRRQREGGKQPPSGRNQRQLSPTERRLVTKPYSIVDPKSDRLPA